MQVIDGSKSRTLANQAFLGNGGLLKVAAQFSHTQLRMPNVATKRAVIRQIMVGSDIANGIQLFRLDAALAVFLNNAPSKLISGAASVSELRRETNAAQLGTGNPIAFEYVQASVMAPPLVFAEPLIIRPGEGVVVRSGIVNVDLTANFEFFEEDNV